MELQLLKDLAMVMAVAGAMTFLCHWWRQPVVIGYLVAGLLIGPYTPPFALIRDLHSIHTMAELGLVLLLFALGLEFNLPKIKKVGPSAGLAALLEVVTMLGLGYMAGRLFGWSKIDSLFLGAILSISSTTIIVKVFMDFKMMHEPFAQVVFGILILEDIVAVAILSILSGLGSPNGLAPAAIFSSLVHVGLFVTLFIVLGLMVVPRFIDRAGQFGSTEMLGVLSLGLCFIGALLASSFQLSIALGAFLAGAVLAASKEIKKIEEWVHPIRDMFSAIFFVSAGMLIQPALLWEHKWAILTITFITLIGKIGGGGLGAFLAGYDLKTSTRVGMSLAQIGEFSFVIASLGLTLKVTSDFLYPLAIAVSSLTTLATPYLIRNSDRMVDHFLTRIPPSFVTKMGEIQAIFNKQGGRFAGHTTTLYSRYLIRLSLYVVLWIALVATTRAALMFLVQSNVSGFALLAAWILPALLGVPLFLTIGRYASHILLLLTTKNKWLLKNVDIPLFYSIVNGCFVFILAASFLLVVAGAGFTFNIAIVIVGGAACAIALMSKRLERSREWLESVMDGAIGLATSEPTRQAVAELEEKGGLGSTDHIALTEDSPWRNRTIRELKLREETGSSIVALYRHGQHVSNPHPDTVLLSEDVLIVFGDADQRAKARTYFTR